MLTRLRNCTFLILSLGVLGSCNLFKKKTEKSGVTGWNYNDKTQGGFNVAKPKDIKTGPGLVFVQGGTFTITNGGVFGSLMSTPIINIPQSAILGMHKIQDRAMAINGQVVIRPMMYLAVSYDHRIIDGKESVSFLVRVKELLENPELLLMGKDPVKTLLEL